MGKINVGHPTYFFAAKTKVVKTYMASNVLFILENKSWGYKSQFQRSTNPLWSRQSQRLGSDRRAHSEKFIFRNFGAMGTGDLTTHSMRHTLPLQWHGFLLSAKPHSTNQSPQEVKENREKLIYCGRFVLLA